MVYYLGSCLDVLVVVLVLIMLLLKVIDALEAFLHVEELTCGVDSFCMTVEAELLLLSR